MRQSVMQKDLCANFRVKVIVMIHIIRIWLFLLYLLNCWSLVCWYIIMSWRVMWKVWIIVFIWSQCHTEGSQSQKMVVTPLNVLMIDLSQPNIVWWYTIMSQNTAQKKNTVIFKDKVKVRVQILRSLFVHPISFELLISVLWSFVCWCMISRQNIYKNRKTGLMSPRSRSHNFGPKERQFVTDLLKYRLI